MIDVSSIAKGILGVSETRILAIHPERSEIDLGAKTFKLGSATASGYRRYVESL